MLVVERDEFIISACWSDEFANDTMAVLRAVGIHARIIVAGDIAPEQIPSWLSKSGATAKCFIAVPEKDSEKAMTAMSQRYPNQE